MVKRFCDICRKDMTNEEIVYVNSRFSNMHNRYFGPRNVDSYDEKIVDESGNEIPNIDIYISNRKRLDMCLSCKRELKKWIDARKKEYIDSFKAEEKEFGGGEEL